MSLIIVVVMGAIVGIISKNNKPISEPLIKMLNKLSYRGKENYCICIDGKLECVNDLDDIDSSNMKVRAS